MKRRPMIGVIGGRKCTAEMARLAEEVGRGIAERGAVLVSGGLGGVMEAACRGAKAAGGVTLGILPDDTTDQANAYVDYPVATGMGYARNVIIVKTADVLIAVGGNYGTLSEVAYALVFQKRMVSLGSWEPGPEVLKAGSAEEAVQMACEALEKST